MQKRNFLIVFGLFAICGLGSALVCRTAEAEAGEAGVSSIVTLFELVIEADPETAKECLAILRSKLQTGEIAGPQREALWRRLQETLGEIVHDTDHPLHFDAALLATIWENPAGMKVARNVLASPGEPPQRRLQALDALIAAGDQSLLTTLEQTLADRDDDPQAFRGQVLASLGRLNTPAVADVVLAQYEQMETELQSQAVELLTQRVSWGKRLLEAVQKDQVPASALNLNQARQLLSFDDSDLAERVRATWGIVREGRNPQREQVIEEMKQLIRENEGDPFAGEKVFKKVCAQCHVLHGEGADVGPDITSNGRNSFEQLLSNVFDPSLVIGAAYQAHTVVTIEGRVLTGLLDEESDRRLVLKVQGGQRETIPRDEIEIHQPSQISMMPEGLEKQLSSAEIVDLFAFLTLDKHPSDPTARPLPGVGGAASRETTDP